MKDWLGNDLAVDDLVLYSSTSTLTGMNLGKVTKLEDGVIQIRLISVTKHGWSIGRLVTLQGYTSAFKSVTKYYGPTLEDN